MNSGYVSEGMDVRGVKYSRQEKAQYIKEGHWVIVVPLNTVQEMFVLRA